MKFTARRVALVAALALGAGAGAGVAFACGLEDPNSLATRRGTLQLAYPNALHVGTAVWQAQLAGTLPRDALAQRGDLSPEARSSLRLIKANAQIGRLAGRLNAEPTAVRHPGVAIVLVGPVMWSRFDAGDGPVTAQVHVAGPEREDVVAITDIAVIEAIADGTIDAARAIETGLMRLYGDPPAVADAHRWLTGAVR
jgi:hypothetical protein